MLKTEESSVYGPQYHKITDLEKGKETLQALKDLLAENKGLDLRLNKAMDKAYDGRWRLSERLHEVLKATGNVLKLAAQAISWFFCKLGQYFCQLLNWLTPLNSKFWQESEKKCQEAANTMLGHCVNTKLDLDKNHRRLVQCWYSNDVTTLLDKTKDIYPSYVNELVEKKENSGMDEKLDTTREETKDLKEQIREKREKIETLKDIQAKDDKKFGFGPKKKEGGNMRLFDHSLNASKIDIQNTSKSILKKS
jgi:predicted nuclease with TOPRIM domain